MKSRAVKTRDIVPALETRPETADDPGFLFALHESVKGVELALVPVAEPMRRQLLDMQFRAMSTGYRSAFPTGRFEIVTLNRAPIGRLITADAQDLFHIVYVALLPEWRHRGIGTILMTSVLDEPRRLGSRCEAAVAHDNLASKRLWTRLGFTERARDASGLVMEWRPAVQDQAVRDVGRRAPPAR
jgi:ribosomal protein S18 acetylase RimI-like enzyme